MPSCSSALWNEIPALVGRTVVRVADLDALGVRRGTVHDRCGPDGSWRRLLPGVLITHRGTPSRAEWQRAALLYAGAGSVVTGLDALARHGLRRTPGPDDPVHVLVPHPRRRLGSTGVLVERTHRMPPVTCEEIPYAPVARAAIDHCRRRPDEDEARAILAGVVQQGLCPVADLHAELRGCAPGQVRPGPGERGWTGRRVFTGRGLPSRHDRDE